MTRRTPFSYFSEPTSTWTAALAVAASTVMSPAALAATNLPITEQQRSTAQKAAQQGVPLSELVANAPDTYTIKRGDTLWDISKLFLKSPWRWPELWGMNLQDIRNPHLIYPGQLLYLDKTGGRARLRMGQPVGDGGTVKLSPRVRVEVPGFGAISSIPFNLIEPFLNEAIIFQGNELAAAPRIVATQEGRVLLSKGENAYVRGDIGQDRSFRIFREAKALKDPSNGQVLGYEAAYVGAADFVRPGESRVAADGKVEIVPSTFTITNMRQEANVGDRLSPVPPREFSNYAPHAPSGELKGQIVSIYGDGLSAGQNQIVSLNRGATDGMERGHVLALWTAGSQVKDTTDPTRPTLTLPDERHGLLFVFRVFDRMSYALILNVKAPVKAGDRFTQP
jgi:LysM domain